MTGISILPPILSALPPGTRELLARTEVQVLPDTVAIVALPSGSREALSEVKEQLLASLDDGEELTLIVREEALTSIQRHWPGVPYEMNYRLVKMVATLPWNTIGYGAAIAVALAEAGVSVGFLSGYSTDYLLVRQQDLEMVQTALAKLIGANSTQVV
jgi:hypothetical protein